VAEKQLVRLEIRCISQAMQAVQHQIPGLRLLGESAAMIVCFTSEDETLSKEKERGREGKKNCTCFVYECAIQQKHSTVLLYDYIDKKTR